ncbi:MAG: ribulose-phosphate 3-epimerase [Candidatus Omnitrophica bacterium]|nr:ribulose-phosphate 3-epimerase [Candidatus Omnitrophota bacterium]
MIRIAPSLLSCDFSRLGEEIKACEKAGADWLHVDVMDGHFVNNLTLGPVIVKAMRPHTQLPLDVHLMIDNPEKYLEPFAKAGSDVLTVHWEVCKERTGEVLKQIKSLGVRAGVSLNPDAPAEAIFPYLEGADLVLVMSVFPGFGGQSFMEEVLPKVAAIRARFKGDLEIDGGITHETGPLAARAGAEILVAGTYVFGAADYAEPIQRLRSWCSSVPDTGA